MNTLPARLDLTIRPMTREDVPAVYALEMECFTDPWSLGDYLNAVHDPVSVYYVACRGGMLLGYGGMWVVSDEAHIVTLATALVHRRRGVGRLLLETLLREAQRRGATKVTLEVRVGNLPALSLYEAYGFRTVAYRHHYYADNGEDAALMALTLAGRATLRGAE